MYNEMFDNLCKKYNDLILKKEYEELLKVIPDLGTFNDYKKEQEKIINKTNNSGNTDFKNALIDYNEILKDDFIIKIYLFNYKVVNDNMLDDWYRVKEISYKNIYEYNSIIINKKSNNYISGLYSKKLLNAEDAKSQYNELINWFINTNIEDLLLDVKNQVDTILCGEK